MKDPQLPPTDAELNAVAAFADQVVARGLMPASSVEIETIRRLEREHRQQDVDSLRSLLSAIRTVVNETAMHSTSVSYVQAHSKIANLLASSAQGASPSCGSSRTPKGSQAQSEAPDARWFNDRPRRTERCGRCGGCGTVEVTYALVAASDYGGASSEYAADAPTGSVVAFVVGCNDIFTACKEAADIAGRASAPVAFEFLDHTVVVHSDDDPTEVARRWWMRQYGETPEQSRARR